MVQQVDQVMSPSMNEGLLQPFSLEEIRCALFQISPSKSPRPDGMTALFFKKYWNIVRSDISHVVLDFLTSGRMLGCINLLILL